MHFETHSKANYSLLSKRYREGSKSLLSSEERMAYLVARFPATFAALTRALQEIKGIPITSCIDWGAGPGTGLWAVRECFPNLRKIYLVERDREMIDLGKKFSEGLEGEIIEWVEADMNLIPSPSPVDLALFSYSLGEVAEGKRASLLLKAWKDCQWLLVVEPGTPAGFKRVLASRDLLIKNGGHVLAPCPHENSCPMMSCKQWCHFSVRLERTREHRQMKEGALGYEDEKFSYILISKQPSEKAKGRLTGHPQKRKCHVCLQVCAENGLKEISVSKREQAHYRWARKAKWGDRCLADLL